MTLMIIVQFYLCFLCISNLLENISTEVCTYGKENVKLILS